MSPSPPSEHPRGSGPAAPRPAASAGSDIAQVVLSPLPGAAGEWRRIAYGIVALGALAVALLNAGIYQEARSRVDNQRRDELGFETSHKRLAARDRIREFERHARFLAAQPHLKSLAATARRTRDPDVARRLSDELDRAAASFGFHSIAVYGPEGMFIAGSSEAERGSRGPGEPDRATPTSFGGFHRVREGSSALMLALPVPGVGPADPVGVAWFEIQATEALAAALGGWAEFGRAAGAYLVEKSGPDVVFLTTPPHPGGPKAGDRVRLADPQARAASAAASGIESTLEWEDASGHPYLAATRFLPEIGWGLVGQIDGATTVQGVGGTLLWLLGLDLALVALTLAGLWLWLHRYSIGLERREQEADRRHSERVQAVLDTAFDAILTFDREGRVRTANRAAEKLLGLPASGVVDLPIRRLLEWGDPEGDSGDLPVPGAVCRAEVLRPGGPAVPVEFTIGTSGAGENILYSAIVRDISERVEAERRIRSFAEGLENSNRRLAEANAQLEAASRLKSEFLANTSHELRTPLNGVIGFLQLVLDGMCDSPEEERDFLNQAVQCSRHLIGLINDVLDIAKIEAGKVALEIQRVDLRVMFDEVYTLVHVQAAQKGLELRFELEPDPPLPARADPGKLKQVLVNLVGNSLKFTPKGSVTVRATAQPEVGHILLEVIDTGIGIPPERQQLIFEKFAQADGSTTRKYGGTGLGLAISRSMVELMGGVIGVQSEGDGKGTRMFFSLPIWQEEEVHGVADDEAPSDRIAGAAGGPLVLLVEDDPPFRRYMATLLQANGYRTAEAANAEAGWLLACRHRPAIVVTDYAMTCAENAALRTGWDLAARMSGDPQTRHIPVVFVTGFDEELREKLNRTAFARRPEHITKPVNGQTLLSRIERLVDPVQGRPVRVLMADDDPTVSAFVRKVLSRDRFHIEVATNGEECLQFLRDQPLGFDILLLDLMMPEVSGYDVLREMALSGLAPDLPVLVLTNYPEPRNAEEQRLLERGLVVEVIHKTSVHDSPDLLPHILAWHLERADLDAGSPPGSGDGRDAA